MVNLFQNPLVEASEEVVHLDLLQLCLKAFFFFFWTGKQVMHNLCCPQHPVLILKSEFMTWALHFTGAFLPFFWYYITAK